MSDFECYCNISDCEPWAWYRVAWHKSSRERICCECKDVIAVGERYQKIVAKGDELEQYDTCAFCADELYRLQDASGELIAKTELACWVLEELRYMA